MYRHTVSYRVKTGAGWGAPETTTLERVIRLRERQIVAELARQLNCYMDDIGLCACDVVQETR